MRKPATSRQAVIMADVAQLAGVSSQTVSRVINGSNQLRPETRTRVERAIARLGYQPNSAARSLVRGRSGVFGVVCVAGGYFGPASIQSSINSAAQAQGFFTSTISLAMLSPELLDSAVSHLTRQGVDGIIVVAGQDHALDLVRRQVTRVPIVLVEGDLTQAPHTVGVDQMLGARLAVEHLLALGHREIVHVTGPEDWAEARARRDQWRRSMAAAGLRPAEPLPGNWTADSGYEAGKRLASDPSTTAIFAANDQTAIGLLLALHQAGRHVPDEISVVGFDDQPETGFLIPPLTTVHQDFAAVGQRAVNTLTSAVRGTPPDPTSLIKPTLVVRGSTAPPRHPQATR